MKVTGLSRNITKPTTKFVGYITPCHWTKESPSGYSLFTTEEDDIYLDPGRHKKKLQMLVNRPVEASGELTWSPKYGAVLKVKRLRPIDQNTFYSLYQPSHWQGTYAEPEYSLAI